ncbi:xylose isomerase [Microlunatus endophyticus]|uniref:Xylose isomerase n=1 Tax=Microlunatus endophyticus TaxID=1716077 RepID=A0A917S263_9ACTN|nr:sugar phosphate isomerase/epimerase family protein [Microlunatus endophyticus]GGL51549.1 xylose isomerase [Microlunatus endophyticus]
MATQSASEDTATQPGFTADNWPIATAMMWAGDGQPAPDAPAPVEQWTSNLRDVADAGFAYADITDSWVRPGDLNPEQLKAFGDIAKEQGVRYASVSAIRRSVIQKDAWEDNLAYSHRTLDAAAELGIGVVSFGLHQALTPQQQEQLWFWTVQGHTDDPEDKEAFALAVERFQDLGRHAAENGQIMSLEMYEDTYLGTADSSVRLVTEIGLDNVGLNPDIGNLVRLHRPIESWQEAHAKTLPYANFWHVKNYFRDEDRAKGQWFATPAPLEAGLISYRSAMGTAVASGFQGVIMCEHYGGDSLSVCATNQDYLRRHALPKRPHTAPRSLVTQQTTLSKTA